MPSYKGSSAKTEAKNTHEMKEDEYPKKKAVASVMSKAGKGKKKKKSCK